MADSGMDRFVTGMLFGAVVGAAIGLLIAPKPGSETRQLVDANGPASLWVRCANGPASLSARPGNGCAACAGATTRIPSRNRLRCRKTSSQTNSFWINPIPEAAHF